MTEVEEEQRRKAGIELANAYREMMATFAWKHLKGVIMEQIKTDATKEIDIMNIGDLTVAHVAVARGIRNAIAKIDDEINWILRADTPITRK